MFTWQPHRTYLDKRNGLPVVEQHSNYVMLHNAGETVYVQRGQVYHGDMTNPCPHAQLPGWFWGAYRNLTPAARKAVGLELPEDAIQRVDQLPGEFLAMFNSLPESLKRQLTGQPTMVDLPIRIQTEAPKSSGETKDTDPLPEGSDSPNSQVKVWICDTCGHEVASTHKGLHIARHRRTARQAAADGRSPHSSPEEN